MKTIKVTATVGLVYAPKKISVFVNHLEDDRYDAFFESQKTFSQEFDAAPGTYIINVLGMNQTDDTTTVSVGGDFILHDTKQSSEPHYVMVFIGTVN